MRELAAQGYARGGKRLLDPEECQEIAEYLIAECRAAGCPLDLRLLENCYSDYRMWEADLTACTWRDLVASRVREATHHFRQEVILLSKNEQLIQRRRILREILQQTTDLKEQLRLYGERSKVFGGGSRADLFRRKAEVDSGYFDEEDAA
jgi:hypothetical protein